jgi:hypothetical protein
VDIYFGNMPGLTGHSVYQAEIMKQEAAMKAMHYNPPAVIESIFFLFS